MEVRDGKLQNRQEGGGRVHCDGSEMLSSLWAALGFSSPGPQRANSASTCTVHRYHIVSQVPTPRDRVGASDCHDSGQKLILSQRCYRNGSLGMTYIRPVQVTTPCTQAGMEMLIKASSEKRSTRPGNCILTLFGDGTIGVSCKS